MTKFNLEYFTNVERYCTDPFYLYGYGLDGSFDDIEGLFETEEDLIEYLNEEISKSGGNWRMVKPGWLTDGETLFNVPVSFELQAER